MSRPEDATDFERWWARCHPFDWYSREIGEPVPAHVRLHVWAMCRAAWMREEFPQRRPDQSTAVKESP